MAKAVLFASSIALSISLHNLMVWLSFTCHRYYNPITSIIIIITIMQKNSLHVKVRIACVIIYEIMYMPFKILIGVVRITEQIHEMNRMVSTLFP